jgi:hypothetical protein
MKRAVVTCRTVCAAEYFARILHCGLPILLFCVQDCTCTNKHRKQEEPLVVSQLWFPAKKCPPKLWVA